MQNNSKKSTMKHSKNPDRTVYSRDKGAKFNKPKRGKSRTYS